MTLVDLSSDRSLLPVSKTSVISQCPHMAEEVREFSRISFMG